MLRDTCHGETVAAATPQRVGETDAALPPGICAFSDSFAIGPSRTGIFRRSRSTDIQDTKLSDATDFSSDHEYE